MDVIGGLGKVLVMPWALLLSLAGSLTGLLTIAALCVGSTPLLVGAALFDWLGLATVADVLAAMRTWIVAREGVLAWVAAAGVVVGIAAASSRSRSAPVAVLSVGVAIEISAWPALIPVAVLFIVWGVVNLCLLVWWRQDRGLFTEVVEWLNIAIAGIPAAVFFIAGAPLRWIINPAPFRL